MRKIYILIVVCIIIKVEAQTSTFSYADSLLNAGRYQLTLKKLKQIDTLQDISSFKIGKIENGVLIPSDTIQLDTAALLLNRPWRESAHGYETPVIEHAHGWLSQGWQTLLQAMPNQTMKAPQYLSAQVLLRQTLLNGFMLAGLFDEDRERFRAPWLDLAMGMEELNALALLKHILQETDLDDKSDLLTWTRDKTDALLNVMEMTRNVALNAEIYW